MSATSYLVREEWKDIKGYEGIYQVSNFGRVKSLKHNEEKFLKINLDKKGYGRIALCNDGKPSVFTIHRLVAKAFVPNPNNYPIINHKDERPSNNYFENLEWCDYKYNNNYGTIKEKLRKKKYKKIGVYDIEGNLIKVYDSYSEAREIEGIKVDYQLYSKHYQDIRNKIDKYIFKYI